MKKILGLFILLAAGSANATLTFTNVSYTADSVTFTIDGDFSGYDSPTDPTYHDQFSLVYGGYIWGTDYDTFETHSWSRSLFDNKSLADLGATGKSGNRYSWTRFDSSLSDAFVSSATVTLSFLSPRLNVDAITPKISFLWGGGDSPSRYTVLQGIDVSSHDVPEPTPLILLGFGLLGLVFSSRRKASTFKQG